MRLARLSLVMTFVLCVLGSSRAQEEEYSKYLFNIGGGISFPQGDLGKFVNDGGNFVVGGGFNFTKHIGVDSEFMWQDLPVNSATLQALSTPGASGPAIRLDVQSHLPFSAWTQDGRLCHRRRWLVSPLG